MVENYNKLIQKLEEHPEYLTIGNTVKADYQNFTYLEQQLLAQDVQVEITGENEKPYGSIEKEVQDGKVILTVYGVDDQTDIQKIISPNGEEKKINYQEDKIIYLNDLFMDVNSHVQATAKNFLNYLEETFYHIQNKKSSEVTLQEDKKNIIVNIAWYWNIKNPDKINQCFEEGYSILTNGNDMNNYAKIIQNHQNSTGKAKTTKIVKDNEITSQDMDSEEVEGRTQINYNDQVEVWKKEILEDGSEKDLIGYWRGEKGNKWIDLHNENISSNRVFRNSIYRLSGTRSLTYEVTQNGTYTFKLVDLCGNTAELSVEVNEL